MKARIRKTGEIVDIICWNGTTIRSLLDTVSYIDSQGVEHNRESLNYYWDFEPIDKAENDAHWQDVRERAAIAVLPLCVKRMQESISRGNNYQGNISSIVASTAIGYADALVKQLKKDENDTTAYVVTRCEEHSDYVEKVFLDEGKAQAYCNKFNGNEDEYARNITKIEVTS